MKSDEYTQQQRHGCEQDTQGDNGEELHRNILTHEKKINLINFFSSGNINKGSLK
jgi:hypothetical protein